MQKVLKSGFKKDHQPLRNRNVEDGTKIANETAGGLVRIVEHILFIQRYGYVEGNRQA